MKNLENPFSVLKATEFTNEEIKDYWVDFGHGKNSVFNVLNPTTDLPKYLLGSKGTGKTHILKYASYPLQKLKADNDFNKIIEEKYIGLYYELYGFNASRFKGKGIDSDQWSAVFEYYLDLFLADKLLKTYAEIFVFFEIKHDILQSILKEIGSLFNQVDSKNVCKNVQELLEYITLLRKKIDSEINNVAFTRKFNLSDIKSLFTPGDLIFGIPEIVSKYFVPLKDVKIIYILDEIEKLEEWQKVYINTLVWDKRKPVTFWLGMRTWGYTTWTTKSTELIREGHEFIKIDLDSFIVNNQELYPEFVNNLCINRLAKYYEKRGINIDTESVNKNFADKFEQYSEDRVIEYFSELGKRKELVHIVKLREKLKNVIHPEKAIKPFVAKLIDGENNVLFQKYKFFKFYKDWYNLEADNKRLKRQWTLENVLFSINDEFKKFKTGSQSQVFEEIIDKRKKDFIAQICVENNEPTKNIEHSGIESLIDRSQYNPRNFLMILMKCVEIGKLRDENPLELEGLVSLETQFRALYDTAEWFYKTIEIKGEEAKKLYDSLQFLSDLLKLYRYCDKPTETSVFGFSVTHEDLSAEAKRQIECMKTYSVIIKDGKGRKERNTSREENRYFLNKTLCPLWGLPIKKRGILDLNQETANMVFDYTRKNQFEATFKKIKSKLVAPFKDEPITTIQKTLEF
jgi:hypothetical protein